MRLFKIVAVALTAFLLCTGFESVAQRTMEKLDRGLVAIKVTNGVFLSWRVFGNDPKDVSFNVYRNGTKINTAPITGASNMVDATGTATANYTVKPIISGAEQTTGTSAIVWASQVKEVNLSHRPSTAHQLNDINVGDLDGDGQYELVVKWYPDNAKDNSQAGVTDNTFLAAYKLDGTFMWIIDLGKNIRSGAHYTQHLVGDYNADGFAEVACKTAPGTKDGTGAFLSNGPAATDNDATSYANADGYVLAGPEYVSLFDGRTGKELASINYTPARGNVGGWGDTYGNRVDRFLATNAYLDGKKPSMVFQRGYYTRMVLAAYDWNGKTLSQRWVFDSNNAGSGGAAGNGNHNLSCADVDGDGYDEIIEGACAIDHDGKLMYTTGLGHGDAMHLGDMDLDNPGLEVWEVHESDQSEELHDAKTGKVFWRNAATADNGRGMAADVDASSAGYEMWSSGLTGIKNSKNKQLSVNKPSVNFRVYWDGDLQDELLDGNKLDKWTGNGTTRLITLTGNSCNGTKSTPNLCADILGDWREEVILHDGASKLYIHTTTIPTSYKLYTLMHDPTYRNAISWQQSAYNQPPYLGFFLGNGVDKAPTPNIAVVDPNLATETVTAQLIAPANNASYCSNTAIELTATATNTAGSISKVEFYDGDVLLSSYNAAPYTYLWTAPSVGTHTVKAIATSSGNIRSVAATANVTVQPVTSLPTVVSPVKYTQNAVATSLTATGTSLKWYTVATGGTASAAAPLPSTAIEGTTNYYVSQTLNGCEGVRAVIAVKIGSLQPSISLKTGWNLIGCPLAGSTDLAKALSSIWANVETVKDFDSFYLKTNIPALNSLTTVEWGEGYMVKVSAPCVLDWIVR